MNRKEAHKHKKRKSWKTWLIVGAFVAVFVSVLVAFLFALAGKDFGGIFGNGNYWLTVGVANGLLLIGFLMLYRIDAQNLALRENDLEDTEWLTVKRLKKMKEFTVTTWDKQGENDDEIVIGAEKKKKDVEIISTSQLHALIVGTTGSGKTTGFVDQNIAILGRSKGKPSMLIADPKKELYEKHAEQLKSEGYTISTLDLREPYSSARWNPMQVLIRRIRQVKELQNNLKCQDGKYCACGEVFLSYDDARTRVQELKDEIFENTMDLVYTLCPVQNKDQPTWEEGARNLIFGLVLPYLKYVVSKVNDFTLLKKETIIAIVGIPYKSAEFKELYAARKKLLKGLPDADIALFVSENEIDPTESIYKFTDNTLIERQAIIKWISEYGIIPEIKDIYPALASYLKKYTFDCGKISPVLTEYFDRYKLQKVQNKVDDEFVAAVNENAMKYTSLDTRANALAAIGDKKSCYLYWIDALGVEYLSYIQDLAKEKGLSIHIDVVRADLPTITSINKGFYDEWTGAKEKEPELDDIKHKEAGKFDYSKCKAPIHLANELEVIERAINIAVTKLAMHSCKKFVIASDHGASRLAVIAQREEKYETDTKGEHSGRCCKYFEGYDLNNAVSENGFVILTDYGRFKGSRAANVEVHGGASLEETVIPIITLSLKNQTEIDVRVLNSDNIVVERKKGITFTLYISDVEFTSQVKVIMNGKPYAAECVDKTHYRINNPDIKRSGKYTADVYDGGNLIGTVNINVKGTVGSANSGFDDLF